MSQGLEALAAMDYPGRFIIAGKSESGSSVVIYGLTGRSDSSKARKFAFGDKTGVVRTTVTDPKILEKGSPSLLLYEAIACYDSKVVVSNGAQTNLIYNQLVSDPHQSPSEILSNAMDAGPFMQYDPKDDRWIDITTFEPDAPNNTPRISLVASPENFSFNQVFCLSGLRESVINSYNFVDASAGTGKFVSTYKGDNGTPLPSFCGPPRDIIIPGRTPKEITDKVFETLKPEVRVAVVTATIRDDLNAVMRSIHDK